jgi:peptidoglycan/LPS O-acetylase OafA/YrhL
LAGIVVLVGCLTISARIPGVSSFFDSTYTRPAAAMFFAGVFIFAVSPWIYSRIWHGVVLGALTVICSGVLHQFLFFATVIWALVYLGQLPLLGRIFRPKQDLSYGIYIYGWPCQQFVVSATSIAISPYVLTLLALSLACIFAALSWHFVERPAIRLGHHLPSMVHSLYQGRKSAFSVPDDAQAIRLGLGLVVLLGVCVGMKALTTVHDFVTVSALPTHIVDFGPRKERLRVPINRQMNGSSTIWVKLDLTPPEA